MHELYEDWCAIKLSTGAKMQCDMIKCAFKWFSWTGTGPRCNLKWTEDFNAMQYDKMWI